MKQTRLGGPFGTAVSGTTNRVTAEEQEPEVLRAGAAEGCPCPEPCHRRATRGAPTAGRTEQLSRAPRQAAPHLLPAGTRVPPRALSTAHCSHRVRVKSGQSPSIFVSRPGAAPDGAPPPTPAATSSPPAGTPAHGQIVPPSAPRQPRKHRDSPARPSPAPFRSCLTHRGAGGRSGASGGRAARAAPPRRRSSPAARAVQEAGGAQRPAPGSASHARGRPGRVEMAPCGRASARPPRRAPPARCRGWHWVGSAASGRRAACGAEGAALRGTAAPELREAARALPPSSGTGRQQHGKQIPAAVCKETTAAGSAPSDRTQCKLARTNSSLCCNCSSRGSFWRYLQYSFGSSVPSEFSSWPAKWLGKSSVPSRFVSSTNIINTSHFLL